MDLIQTLMETSILIDPIPMFESPGIQEEVIRRLVSRWEELARRSGKGKYAVEILEGVMNSINKRNGFLVFYGSAVYAPEGELISDVDILRVEGFPGVRFENPASPELHVSTVNRLDERGFMLLNALLLFQKNGEALRKIIRVREEMYELPFEGIIPTEVIIAYSLMKILQKNGHSIERRLGRLEGDLGEGGRELKPRELTHAIMVRASEFSRAELTDMTNQALRRIRIREGARAEIVSRFVGRVAEIRTAKMR